MSDFGEEEPDWDDSNPDPYLPSDSMEQEQEIENKIRKYTEWLQTWVPPSDTIRQLQNLIHIGSGAFGHVYRTSYQGSSIALKQIKVNETDRTSYASLLESFEREVTNIRRCNHKNIVKYIGCFSDRECLYLMTEYLGIGSLEHCLHKTRTDLSIELSLSIAFDVAQGMMYLHELNPQIIHRDLSPSNVLLDEGWVAKISDFGLSRLKDKRDEMIQASRVGRFQYAAPEILRPERLETVYSEKVDVYSYAIVTWELFSRRTPFEKEGDQGTVRLPYNGERPSPMPERAPDWVNSMIVRSWDQKHQNRPSFRDIVDIFRLHMTSS